MNALKVFKPSNKKAWLKTLGTDIIYNDWALWILDVNTYMYKNKKKAKIFICVPCMIGAIQTNKADNIHN